MGRKKSSGLIKRGEFWHLDKQIRGKRICESTGTSNLAAAEEYLNQRIYEIRQAKIFGERPNRTFRQAATKFLNDAYASGVPKSVYRYAQSIVILDRHIGDIDIQKIHMGSLEPFIQFRRKEGMKNATIGRDLAVVRRITRLAAGLWRDENGLSWIQAPPLIQLPKLTDARQPYPLSWSEQQILFECLPSHLQSMALFKVNAGCRDKEVCMLRWDMEVKIPELNTLVFIIPKELVKNGEDRLVVLNKVALSVIDNQRGKHSEYVFTYKDHPIGEMNNSAWRRARRDAVKVYEKKFETTCPNGFRNVRVHDLKHTFGRRLRSAGVSFEDRQDLLGHKSGRITTHYSEAEITNLIDAANKVCNMNSRKNPALTVLRTISKS